MNPRHEGCSCQAAVGQEFCSDFCSDFCREHSAEAGHTAHGAGGCGCGHPDCA